MQVEDLDSIVPPLSDEELENADRGDELPEDPEATNQSEDKTDDEDEKQAPEDDKASEVKDGEGKEEAKDGEKEDEKGEDKQDKPRRRQMVPIERLNTKARLLREERARREELERKLAELEAQGKAQPQTQAEADELVQAREYLRQLDQALEQARADGDVEKAIQLTEEARNVERYLYQASIQRDIQEAQQSAVEEMKLNQLVEQVEQMYDVLNPDSESYDQETVDRVAEIQNALVAAGEPPSVALLKAVEYLMPSQEVTEAREAEEAAQKREPDVKKNVQAAKQTPPDIGDAGISGDAAGATKSIDVTSMDIDEFEALPESTLAKLRGDLL